MKHYFQLMRFHRPIPILLLLWPIYSALIIANPGEFDFKVTLIFTIGAIVMRAAGCVANDLADRNFDTHVARTKDRPLAARKVSMRESYTILLVLVIIAFVLVLFLNQKTILLSLIALGLTFFYPFTKRFFILPQLVLGLTYNFGVIMVFAALDKPFSWSMLALYIASISWTLAYDTLYALCDAKEDQHLGLHSSALTFGKKVYGVIVGLQILMILLWVMIGLLLHVGFIFYLSLFFASGLCVWQDVLSRYQHQHLRAFLGNHWIGLVLFIGLFSGTKSIFI